VIWERRCVIGISTFRVLSCMSYTGIEITKVPDVPDVAELGSYLQCLLFTVGRERGQYDLV
jgi:hypothetical protein